MSNLQISLALFSIAGITLCWLFLQLRPGARERRHARLQEKARRVLIKINTIPNMPQRLAYLRKIDPLAFEELLLETFERRGFKVTRNTHYSGDGGVDGIVTLHGERFLVQAKRYGKHIKSDHIREFARLLDQNNCRGFFCHTGRTGPSCKDILNQNRRVILLSGERLLDFLNSRPEESSVRHATSPVGN